MTHHLANYTLQAMVYLAVNEFTTPEREQRLGVLVSYRLLLRFLFHLIISSFGLNGIMVFFYYTVVI